MSDRVSTIRFKVEGIQGTANAIQQLAREIQASQVAINRAAKVQAQALAGGDAEAIRKSSELVVAARQRQNRVLADADYAATHTRFEVEKRMLDRTLAELLPVLATALAQSRYAQHRLEWLVED